MRSTGNFSPEWGYLAPAPSILRTVRVVLVATAVGATAGAGVVFSLVDRSGGEGQPVAAAAHAIVTSAQAAPSPANTAATMTAPATPVATAAPAAAAPAMSDAKPVPAAVTAAVAAPVAPTPIAVQAAPQVDAVLPPPATAPAAVGPTTDANAVAAPPQPAVAALSDAPVTTAPATSAVTNDSIVGDQTVGPQLVPQKKTKHHTATANDVNPPGLGTALRHLFSARAGTSYYPNRGL